MSGIELIAAERERQVSQEGWTADHDDEHADGELSHAAVCYCFANAFRDPGSAPLNGIYWPWDPEWWRPSDDLIRNLVKAGALIAAEIDRLQRAAPQEKPE